MTYNLRGLDPAINTRGMSDRQVYEASAASPIRLSAGYYRGPLYRKVPHWRRWKWITVCSSADRKHIVVVPDEGPVRFSEDFGANWKPIRRPGRYEFTLSQTAKGSALVALVTFTNVTFYSHSDAPQETKDENWYSVVSAADGSQLAVSGGHSHSAPALKIMRSATNLTVAWPAIFTGFVLERNSEMTTANWIAVTNPVASTGEAHQVALPLSTGNAFFRLRKP